MSNAPLRKKVASVYDVKNGQECKTFSGHWNWKCNFSNLDKKQKQNKTKNLLILVLDGYVFDVWSL